MREEERRERKGKRKKRGIQKGTRSVEEEGRREDI